MRRHLPSVIFVIISCLLLIWPAIYNGFPLVYSDTGSYLWSSITLETPESRPLFYGLFVNITAMDEHLWVPVIAQGLISGWLLLELLRTLLPESGWIIRYLLVTALAFLTGISWYTGQLMPDLFTPLAIVLVYLIIADKIAKKWKRAIYFVLLLFFAGMHFANLLIVAFVAGCIAIVFLKKCWYNRDHYRSRLIGIFGMIFLTGLTHCLFNYAQFGVFKMSRGTNLFLAAKCLETPLLKTYMRENPNKIAIPFADQIDSIPDGACGFLWGGESPLNQPGVDKVVMNEAYGPVLQDMLSQSRYRKLFIREAFSATWKQLQLHKVGSGLVSYPPPSGPFDPIEKEFESGAYGFIHARQQSENFETNYMADLSGPVYYGSLLIILAGLFFRVVRQRLGLLILVILAGVVANAFVTAGLANVYDRLQTRVLWLVTFLAIVVLVELYNWVNTRKSSSGKTSVAV